MTPGFTSIYLIRHGETAWSLTGQHTGSTDLLLTVQGEQKAVSLSPRLRSIVFDHVFTSPLLRARRTCELAGFADVARVDPDLVEWDYGEYEGQRTEEIRTIRPGWKLFRDGPAGGESLADISARADRVVARLRGFSGSNVLLFSSGHLLRVLAARWLQLDISAAALLALDTASISVIGYGHGQDEPMIRLWNDLNHCPPISK